MHEKEIGSWFSQASPIKTTAGFWIKRRIVLPVIPYAPLVIPTLGRDLIGIPGNGTKRKSLPTNYTNLHEKEIGSWFSQASPIKTTAGFWIKRRIVLPVIPYAPSCHPDVREGSHWNTGEWDEEEEFAHELHEFARKGNWQLVFSGFADKNNCRFLD
ncbi:hypothetical protein [Chlorobium phaeobacteroides]|uniref:hypothetical protein n=1 Tax=Chlorobium phaeobacteroides TaxID=1096 RepID=UPI001232630A|nr:hypothetical protein [Chlorobium phaeobacteroides]